ncbi:asparaginase [Sphaerisporangium melleum]|uniref:Asparaginase n=1 Tax=Sphaerisporangium melleum TaxID=321316 RepID=A0A917VE14_9ACTN|nr:asparaginase [Sphaerisporangium melleum]GGK66497.1 asparaginase [Sphaerisporangium melleum]GII68591.1 asparaginase [Sphaerisporangium melleum]
MYARLAEVVRSGFTESIHFGSVAALAPDGTLAFALGPVDEPMLPRSSAKPFQALACLSSGAALAGPRLAIAAGSHTGEDLHAELVQAMLHDAGLGTGALRCPADWPENEAARHAMIRAGEGPARVRMNCSGKHAAMLTACAASGWDTASYLDPAHPLQQRVRSAAERLSGEKSTHTAVDGCGAPLFALSLAGLARAVRALTLSPEGTPERAVADAMRDFPEYVGGTGHANTELMRALPGAVVKGGAEGVLVVATSEGHAVAVKAIDGGPRATTAIALAALARLGAVTTGAQAFTTVPVLGGGLPVGEIRPTL